MEDLSEFIRKLVTGNIKEPGNNFGVQKPKNLQKRIIESQENRKYNRNRVLFEKRNIQKNMTPYTTPNPKQKGCNIKVTNRAEMLKKWKEERDKKKQLLKQKSKPVFKVCKVPVEIGLPNLDVVNKEIKGKPIASFAPKNHKFKPPANITSMVLNQNKKETGPTTSESTGMVTRSKAKQMKELEKVKPTTAGSKKLSKSSTKKTTNKKNPKIEKVQKKKPKPQEEKPSVTSSSSGSTDYPIDLSLNEKLFTPGRKLTPKKNNKENTSPAGYISPFVTISRGKESARKEYKQRQSQGGESSDNALTSSQAAASYFTELLDKEIGRIEGLCEKWRKYKEEENPPVEAIDAIDVTIGQSQLLITKKFVQFRGLIEQCRMGQTEQEKVTCMDLHGFWDMMYKQVENLDKRFSNIDELKANNWQEFFSELKKIVKKPRPRIVKKPKTTSNIRELIKAARLNNKPLINGDGANFDGGFFVIQSPEKKHSPTPTKLQSTNKNMLNTVLNNEAIKRRSSGLIMMRASQMAKNFEDNTPRSICKNNDMQSSSKPKAVLFEKNDGVQTDITESDACSAFRRSSRRPSSRVRLF